jgi:hypothetical protein
LTTHPKHGVTESYAGAYIFFHHGELVPKVDPILTTF